MLMNVKRLKMDTAEFFFLWLPQIFMLILAAGAIFLLGLAIKLILTKGI